MCYINSALGARAPRGLDDYSLQATPAGSLLIAKKKKKAKKRERRVIEALTRRRGSERRAIAAAACCVVDQLASVAGLDEDI